MSKHPGSEILAVKTLRNSLMSATITASTAALALMGSISLTVSSVATDIADFAVHLPSPRLALLASLFASLVCSAMAIESLAHGHLWRAGLLYSWSLRCLLLVAPILAGLVHPLLAPLGSLRLVASLALFDHVPWRMSDSMPSAK